MINLTIQSLNNKSITAIDLTNNSVIGTFNQSQATSLPNANILINVQTADTFTLSNLGHAVRQVPNDWIFFFIASALIVCAIATVWLFKRR